MSIILTVNLALRMKVDGVLFSALHWAFFGSSGLYHSIMIVETLG